MVLRNLISSIGVVSFFLSKPSLINFIAVVVVVKNKFCILKFIFVFCNYHFLHTSNIHMVLAICDYKHAKFITPLVKSIAH